MGGESGSRKEAENTRTKRDPSRVPFFPGLSLIPERHYEKEDVAACCAARARRVCNGSALPCRQGRRQVCTWSHGALSSSPSRSLDGTPTTVTSPAERDLRAARGPGRKKERRSGLSSRLALGCRDEAVGSPLESGWGLRSAALRTAQRAGLQCSRPAMGA